MKKEIGKAITATKQHLNKSNYKINRETGLIQPQIVGIESGTTNYTIDSLIKVLESLNLCIKIEDKNQ